MILNQGVAQETFGRLVDHIEGRGELLETDRTARYLDSLRGFGQMRRGVESGADAGRAQSGFNHRAGRAFSIRAGHVYEPAGALRIIERFEQRRNRVQPKLRAFEFVSEGVEVPDRIRIGHRVTGTEKDSRALAM